MVFIYMMGKKPFDPCSFISDFNHVFIAVRRVEVESRGELGYHINVISRVFFLFFVLFLYFIFIFYFILFNNKVDFISFLFLKKKHNLSFIPPFSNLFFLLPFSLPFLFQTGRNPLNNTSITRSTHSLRN